MALRSPASGKRKKKRHKSETSVPQEAVNGHGTLEVDTALGPAEMDVGKKKKKKQPKELEVMELVATEPMAKVLEPLGMKKKKKPKDTEMVERETGMLEQEEKPMELELIVKTESLGETVLSPTKKRKRQKWAEGTEPVEGMRIESQLQVKMKPQEEAMPSLKKKKEKGYKVLMEPGIEAKGPEMRPLELQGEKMEPELPHEVELQAKAALTSTKKTKKKEKWPGVVLESQEEAMVPALAGDLEPQAALASTKKKKKEERGHKATESGIEMTDPRGEMIEPELPDEGEPKARTDPTSTKKRKKQGQESRVPEMASQEKIPELPLNQESGGVAPTGREKKRKKKLQQDPA